MLRGSVKIPYVNLTSQHASLKEEVLAAIARVLERGQFILGDEVSQFESHFSELCGVRHAVGVNSGTDALVLALRALGVGPGDEVITAPNSFVASASCIALVGAVPTFADVGDDYNLDSTKIEAAITSRTRAILPVHLTGRPADMDPILAIARGHGLYVIEDCAQAVAARYRGRPVGSFGMIGCFSLHPLKTLNACGDGGVVVTDDPVIADKIKVLRNIGLRTRDDCVSWAGNSRLDTLQAAVLLVKLNYLERWTEGRRANARYYQETLADVRGLTLPVDRPYEYAVYHTFVVQADGRDELRQHLAERGIDTAIHYPVPIHLQTVARDLGYRLGSFPVAERQAKRILSLPVYPELRPAELETIARAIRDFYGG